MDLLEALYAYRRFHGSLMGYREAFVVADFAQVTEDFGSVVDRMNEKYGTTFGRFSGTPAEVRRCLDLIARRPTLSPSLLGFESGEVSQEAVEALLASLPRSTSGDAAWIPSRERDDAKRALERLSVEPRDGVRPGAGPGLLRGLSRVMTGSPAPPHGGWTPASSVTSS